jgi:hypothetical protein
LNSIELSTKERDFIGLILDWWEEGLGDTTTQVIEDHSIDTPEELMSIAGDIDEQRRTIASIRSKLG